jgi:hypothetical protein
MNIDVVGLVIISSDQNRGILTMKDELKYLIAVPVRDQTAEQNARNLVANVVLIYACA